MILQIVEVLFLLLLWHHTGKCSIKRGTFPDKVAQHFTWTRGLPWASPLLHMEAPAEAAWEPISFRIAHRQGEPPCICRGWREIPHQKRETFSRHAEVFFSKKYWSIIWKLRFFLIFVYFITMRIEETF